MAYEDDRDLDLDRSLYEEDPAYEADTYFGERLDDATLSDSDMEVDEVEEYDVEDVTATAADEGFGESIKHEDTDSPKSPSSDSEASEESMDKEET